MITYLSPYNKDGYPVQYDSINTVGVLVPYMDGGSLQDIIDTGGVQDESILSIIGKQFLLGIQALHETNHIHRDLKV